MNWPIKMRTLLIVLLMTLATHARAMDVTKVFEVIRPSVVLIVAYDENDQPTSIGSGFFFGDQNTVATNLHVIQNAAKLAIKLNNGETGWIDIVLGIDEERDLALLHSGIAGNPIPPADSLPDIGEDILAIGNPSGLEGTVSTGIISGIRTEDGSQYFQITAPISPGSSGGPVIDENMEVLGVSTFFLDGTQSLNFAMPAAYLTKLYNSKSEKSLTVLKSAPSRKLRQTESNVVVMYPIWGHLYVDSSQIGYNLTFSLGNKSLREISNIKLLIKFYINIDDELPVHFMLTEIEEKIPSNLSLRIEKQVLLAKKNWKAKFTVLDYEITKDSQPSTLLNFD